MIPPFLSAIWFFAAVVFLWRTKFWRFDGALPLRWRLSANSCGLLAAGGILLSGIVGSLTLRAMGAGSGEEATPTAMLAALVASALTTIAIYWILSHRGKHTDSVANAAPCSVARAVGIGALGLLLAWPLVQCVSMIGSAVQTRLTGVEAPTIGHHFLETIREQGSSPVTWGLIAAIALLGPLAEELIWRGAVQQGLKQIGASRGVAVAITAVAFAFFHWGAVPEYSRAAAIPALAVLGVALGYLMERTGRLWASFAAHSLFNCANLFLFSMLPQ